MKTSTISSFLALTVVAIAAPANITGAAESKAVQILGIGAFHPIENVGNNLCLQPADTTSWAPVVQLAPCNSNSLSQLWAPLSTGGNIYEYQNGATQQCIWADDTSFSGEIIRTNECTLSDGSGNWVSNAEWDSGTTVPNIVTLKTHVHFKTANLCLDGGSQSTLLLNTCSGSSLTQRWIVGFN